jgi:hypothetical protein
MTNQIVERCLNEIEEMMRKTANKRIKDKIYYEFRINTEIFKRLRIPLLELYQRAFEQGVYVAK